MVSNKGTVQMFLTEPMGGYHGSAMHLPVGVMMPSGENKLFVKRFACGELHVAVMVIGIAISLS